MTHVGKRGERLSIGDVSKICGVPVHTIRFWEREFRDHLRVSRTQGKQRRYTDEDIKKLLRIKSLLWNQRFSIRAAKRILSAGTMGNATFMARRFGSADTSRLFMRLAQFAGSTAVVSEHVA
jgi:DNA-binding transcriptional MerR regulator